VDVLPQLSVAVQVLTKVYSCGHVPGIESVTKATITLLSHASVAVAMPKLGVAGHSIGLTTVGQVIVGDVMSPVTVKVAEHVAGASQSLVTVQVTVVVPPHESGATVELLVSSTPHPPV